MKRFLIPIDLTETSVSAFRYALSLSMDHDHLDVLHVPNGLLNVHHQELYRDGVILAHRHKLIVSRFLRSALDIELLPANIEVVIAEGNVGQAILTQLFSRPYDLLIMGARDKTTMFDRWLGATSLDVATKSIIPTILVPQNCHYAPYRYFLVATDQHLRNTGVLDAILEWNLPYSAFVKFLHILTNGRADIASIHEQIIAEYFESKEVDFAFEVEVESGPDISSALLAYANQDEVDLLVVILEDRGTIPSLLFKSVSNDLYRETTIPMLFLPA